MMWTESRLKFYCECYYELRDYELNPFEHYDSFRGDKYAMGETISQPPFEELIDMNWDFDRALKSLGDKEAVFRKYYIDGLSMEEVIKETGCSCGDIQNVYEQVEEYLMEVE